MLIGEYIHTIDDKNRVSLPAKFRKEMGKNVVIAPAPDQCLFIFTIKEWNKVSNRLTDNEHELSFLKADKRNFNRFMLGRASDVEVDSIGRILIPDFLKDRIGLKGKAALVGVGDRVEIWNDKTWNSYKIDAEKTAGTLAEKLAGER
jgi:MraZ protein